MSNTCLPLPLTPFARAIPLLSPIAHPNICAFSSERFELRTSGLGCGVSTITFLTCIVTIFSTILAIILGWLSVKLGIWMKAAWKTRRGGWVVYGDGSGEVWVRRREGWREWWRRIRRKDGVEDGVEDEEVVRERLRGTRRWSFWRRETPPVQGDVAEEVGEAESRPLLGG